MVFVITLSGGRNVVGAIQGYGGECRTIERANEYLSALRRRKNPHSVYIKVGFDPITGAHNRLDAEVHEIIAVDEFQTEKAA